MSSNRETQLAILNKKIHLTNSMLRYAPDNRLKLSVWQFRSRLLEQVRKIEQQGGEDA